LENSISKALLPGMHEIRLLIDPDNRIDEVNKSNNSEMTSVFVPPTARRPASTGSRFSPVIQLLIGTALALIAAAGIFIYVAWRRPHRTTK
jgi:hypothetical protein